MQEHVAKLLEQVGSDPVWFWIGLCGNAAWFTRFLLQWIASERAGESIVPVSFWYLSIAGTFILLAYALHKQDPVFTLAYLPNAVVYVRNVVLVRRKTAREAEHPPTAAVPPDRAE